MLYFLCKHARVINQGKLSNISEIEWQQHEDRLKYERLCAIEDCVIEVSTYLST